jgi:hypothetical protein
MRMSTAEIGGGQSDTLGEPSLEAAGLRVWVHGRLFPSAHDPDEGNLLRAAIHCESEGVAVKADDAAIRASDVARWVKDCGALLEGATQLARLSLKKGVFEIVLQPTEDQERIRMHVAVVPGEGARAHSFDFDLFRHELEEMVRQLGAILRTYPVRGAGLAEAA